jgi:sigma-B regulation protein RsbU (phosphoserine phosphatase)
MTDLTNELDKKAYHLKTLSDVSQEIFFLKEPKEIIPTLLLMVMGSYGSMKGLAFLLNKEQTAIEVFSQQGVEGNLEDDLMQLIESKAQKSVIAIDQSIQLEEDGVKRQKNIFLDFLISNEFLIFNPFILKNKFTGGLALGAKLVGEPYSVDDLELLSTLANQGTISVENARLQQKQLAQESLRKELEIATNIQLSFLPSNLPIVQGIDLAVFFQPAKEVGGDFYDFIELPDNKLGIVIADVCGKGIPAALYMALSRALIRACSAHEPVDMVKAVLCTNKLIQECANVDLDLFVTLVFSIYDPVTRVLRYVRAGHNYPIYYNKDANHFELLKGQGLALGMFPNILLEEKEINLKDGDIVVFYTDGITEAPNSEQEMFGVERVTKLLTKYQDQPASVIAEKIKSSVVDFEGNERQFDDLTLIILKINRSQ